VRLPDPPLEMMLGPRPCGILDMPSCDAQVRVYNTGTVVVTFQVALPTPITPEALVNLSGQILEAEDAITAAAEPIRDEIFHAIADACKPGGVPELVEDYTVFKIIETDPKVSGEAFLTHVDVARLLLGERHEIAASQRQQLTHANFSYYPDELVLLEPLADKLPPGVLDDPAYVPPKTDGSGRNREALRSAAGLLDEAGWTVKDGVRQKDGVRLEFEFLLVGEGFERITVPYMKNLERIGVKTTVRTIDPAQYTRRMEEFDFDLTVSRKVMSLTPGVELRNYFHSSSANSKGSQNTAGVSDPAVDSLIETISGATTRAELTAAVKALDRVLRAMHIWVPQWHKGSHTIAYWDIYARPPEKPPYDRGVEDLWWIDQEKHARLKNLVGG